MSGAKHTPGPWLADGNVRVQGAHPDHMYDIARMCRVHPAVSTPEEQILIERANAQLIASAPETADERDRLRKSNAELVVALKRLANGKYLMSCRTGPNCGTCDCCVVATAITNAELEPGHAH